MSNIVVNGSHLGCYILPNGSGSVFVFYEKFSVAAEKYDPEADEEGDKVKVALIVSIVGLRLGNSVEIFLKFVMTVLL